MENNLDIRNSNFFYSENWRMEVFAFGSLPFFDVMVDNEYLYLIEMPKWKHDGFKEKLILFFSLFLGLLGAYYVGDTRKIKYYKTYRSSWINSDSRLTSQDYVKHIFLKVPIADLKASITFGKNKFYLSYNGKMVALVRKLRKIFSFKPQRSIDIEFTRLSKCLEKYFPIKFVRNKFTIA